MLISSWNVNSVRARIENIKSYILKYKPDILMMQEIKTEDINFPYEVLFLKFILTFLGRFEWKILEGL